MAKIECKDCGDMVDVEARTVTLPFVCKWCEDGDGRVRSANTNTANTYELVYLVVPEGTPDGCSEPESEGLEGQFYLDTKLIEDLSNQLAKANKRIKLLENRLDSYKTAYSTLYKVDCNAPIVRTS